MLLGAWGGKSGSSAEAGSGGGGHLNPATPVLPSSSNPEPFVPGGGHQRISTRRSTKLRYLLLVSTFGLYLILGASIFSSIEAPAMEAIANNVDQLRGKFLKRHPNVRGE